MCKLNYNRENSIKKILWALGLLGGIALLAYLGNFFYNRYSYNIIGNILSISLDSPDYNSLILGVYEVEGTVSALCISIIALITGLFKETRYGIKVATFTMDLQHNLFCTRTIVFESLAFLCLNYFFLAQKMFFSVLIVFFSSIILVFILFVELSSPFVSGEKVETKIKAYVINHFTKHKDYTLIENISNEIENAISHKNMVIVKNDMAVYNDCLFIGFEDEGHYSSWESSYTASINSLCENGFIIESINLLQNNMKTSLDKNNKSIFNFIFSLLERVILNAIKNKLSLSEVLPIFYFLFNSPIFEIKLLSQFSYQIVKAVVLSDNDVKLKTSEIKKILTIFDSKFYDKQKSKIAFESKLYTFKVILDYDPMTIDAYIWELKTNEQSRKIYIQLVIYLYYLIVRESAEFVSEEKKHQYEVAFKKLGCSKSDLFYVIRNIDSIYKTITESLHSWEIFSEHEFKSVIMDYVVRDFFIFSAILTHNVNVKLETIKSILKNSEIFNVINGYFPNDNANSTFLQNFYDFAKLFGIENPEQYTHDINSFKDFMIDIYKNSEIANSNYDDAEISHNIQILFDRLVEQLKSSLLKDYISDEHTDKQQIKLLSLSSFKFAYVNNYIDKDSELININSILIAVLQNIVIRLSKEDLIIYRSTDFDTHNKLDIIFDQIDDLARDNVHITTLVDGWQKNANHMYDENKQNIEKYNNLSAELGAKFVSSPQYGLWIGLNTDELNLVIRDLKIEVRALSREEMDKFVTRIPDSDLVYITITNDIKAKFTRQEAYEYLSKTRLNIDFYADISMNETGSKKLGFVLNTNIN